MYRLITTVRNHPAGTACKVYRDSELPEEAGQWLVCTGNLQTDPDVWCGRSKDEAVKEARRKLGHHN